MPRQLRRQGFCPTGSSVYQRIWHNILGFDTAMLTYRISVWQGLPRNRPPRFFVRNKQRQPSPRQFTQDSQLLFVSPIIPRPQLPFLHSPSTSRSQPNISRSRFQYQLARLITTDQKLYIKDQLRKGARYTVYGGAALVLFAVLNLGVQDEILNRRYPSPEEWSFLSRMNYRLSRNEEVPSEETGLVDWSQVGSGYQQLLERLEDASIDGKDLRPILQEEGDLHIAGLGKAGLDISSKSEHWRRGYHECLMGAAKASENRDGWVTDTTKNVTYPPELVVGPSNPRPRPVPFGAGSAPLEENCVPALPPAETYYMKILTTSGFTSRQRLDAALAYADWLDFKGLTSTAEDMYDWGLDIAMGALPDGTSNVIDIKTGIINERSSYVSSNVFRAAGALAYHHARNNKLSAALPIFLSILRAGRNLPEELQKSSPPPEKDANLWSSVSTFVKWVILSPPYPTALPTGDEMPARTSATVCEEAGVMSHIGEILFASTATPSSVGSLSDPSLSASSSSFERLQNQHSGLSWTREAVDIAEATLKAADKDDIETRDKCTECLAIGVENWSTMVETMLKNEKLAAPAAKTNKTWFWGKSTEVEDHDMNRWESELQTVNERLRSVRKLLIKEEERKSSKGLFATLFSII